MSSAQAFYFMLHETTNSSAYSWRREYLKLSLSKVCRLEKVVEYENNDIYRPTKLAFGLPYGVQRSTKLEYTQALLRYRKDAAARKLQAEQEKEARKLADKKLDGLRGVGPAFKPAQLRVSTAPELLPGTALFDDFTIVDTEYQGDRLLEVAAIRYKNWVEVDRYESLVLFKDWLWPKTTEITKITASDLLKGKPEGKVLQSFIDLAEGSLLVAHNIGADRSKFEAACMRQGREKLANKWFCTLKLARARLPKDAKCGLTDLCDRFKFGNKDAHRAMFYQEDPITTLDPKARKVAPTLFAA
jgi:hypothetical protein